MQELTNRGNQNHFLNPHSEFRGGFLFCYLKYSIIGMVVTSSSRTPYPPPERMTTKVRLPLVFSSMALLIFFQGNILADTLFQVATLAGNGSPGFTDGVGTNAAFSQPNGVAFDSTGNVYVADLMNHAVRKITTNGVVTTLAGNGTSGFRNGIGTNASFYYPSGVAVDGSGNVFVADIYNHAIRKITTNGTVTTFAGKGTYGFRNGTGTNALFDYPIGVAVDGSGNVFVADSDNCSIRKIATNGVVTTFAGTGSDGFADGTGTNASFSFPQGIAVDGSGNVFVADAGNNAVRKISPDGVVMTLAGNGSYGFQNSTGTNASFREPNAVAVDASGNVFVADGNNAIRKITSVGAVTTVAGSTWGFMDGAGTGASFKYPRGLAPNASGTICVADTDNNAIRKIVPVYRKTPQTIAFPAIAPVTYSTDLGISLTATSSSALPVSYSSTTTNVSISGSNLTVRGAGTALIVASQSGNDDYAQAQPVTNVLMIAKASNPITFVEPTSRTYSNGDTVYLAATAPGGTVSFVSGNSNALTIDGAQATILGAGIVSIRAVQAGGSNYVAATPVIKKLVVNKAPQSISFSLPETNSFSPNGQIPLSGSSSSGLPVVYRSANPGILSISGSNAVMKRRGTASVTASQPGNANYLGVTNDPLSITIQ